MWVWLLVLIVSFQAFGEEQHKSSHLRDILYIPSKGMIFGETSISHETSNYSAEFGTQSIDYRDISLTTVQTIGYGFSDRLSASVKAAYSFYGRFKAQGDPEDEKREGPIDPIFSLNYRFLDERTNTVTADFFFRLRPSIFSTEYDSNSKESAAAEGADAASIGARLGKKYKRLQMALEFLTDFVGQAVEEDTASESGYNSKLSQYYRAGLTYLLQTDLSSLFSYRIGVGFNYRSEVQQKEADSTKSYQEQFKEWSFQNKLIANIVEDKLLLAASYIYQNLEPIYIRTNSGRAKIVDSRVSEFSLSAVYQF